MTTFVAFPIEAKVLDPSQYPEFKGETGDAGPATEWRSTATHLQQRPVGGGDEDWVDVVALSEITGPSSDLADLGGSVIAEFRNAVQTVSGALTSAEHSGNVLVTSGNVTIPNAAGDVGFTATIIAGGAHTVTFNSTVSAAMAAGDVMTVIVQSTTVIHAVLTVAADKVAFT